MGSFSLRHLASFTAFKPIQDINKFGGILRAVLLEFRLQPQNPLRYLAGFFHFLPYKTYITAVICVYLPDFDLYVHYVLCQNSNGKCLKYDVKVIRLAHP